MIRTATAADIPRLLELGAAMHAESPRFRGFPFAADRVGTTIAQLLDSPAGCVLVAESGGQITGGLVAFATPHFACDVLQACDLALFIASESRGGTAVARLVRAYREWAQGIGAEPSIGISTGVHPERTGALFAALGAEQTATLWTWRTPCASAQRQ